MIQGDKKQLAMSTNPDTDVRHKLSQRMIGLCQPFAKSISTSFQNNSLTHFGAHIR